MVEESNGGKATPPTIEKFNFEGKEVAYTVDESGKAMVETPEGLTPDEEKKFVEQVPSLLASLNKKNLEGKQMLSDYEAKMKELELKERELKLKEAELASKSTQATSDKRDIFSFFGVGDKDALSELAISDPEYYAEKMSDYVAYKSNPQISRTLGEYAIDSQMTAEGYDPNAVKAFMRSQSITDVSSAYNLYKMLNPKTANSAYGVRQTMQANAPEIMPAGSLTKKGDKLDILMEKFRKV